MAEQIVIGLIDLWGVHLIGHEASGYSIRFSLVPWRDENGTLHQRYLLCEIRMSLEDAKAWQQRLKANTVIRAKMRITESAHTYNFELLENNYRLDEELNDIAIERATPKYYQHERFGTLSLNRERHRYETQAVWAGTEIKLHFETEDETELVALLKNADDFWAEQENWNERLRDYIVQEILKHKNTVWLGDDEKPYTAEQFLGLLKLESIYIDNEFDFNRFTFSFDDAMLFIGRSIRISGDTKDGSFSFDL